MTVWQVLSLTVCAAGGFAAAFTAGLVRAVIEDWDMFTSGRWIPVGVLTAAVTITGSLFGLAAFLWGLS